MPADATIPLASIMILDFDVAMRPAIAKASVTPPPTVFSFMVMTLCSVSSSDKAASTSEKMISSPITPSNHRIPCCGSTRDLQISS